MNVKFIVAPALAIAAATALILIQDKPADDSLELSAVEPSSERKPANNSLELNTDDSAKSIKIQKEAVSQEKVRNVSDDNGLEKIDDLEVRYRLLSTNEDYPTLASRLNAIKDRRPDLDISGEAVLTALARRDTWETVQDPPARVKEKLTEQQVFDGRRFVKFDPIKVETLMPGDSLYIAIDDLGIAYDMTVEEVEKFDDGNLMWKGGFLNAEGTEAEGGTVTITQSSNITVAAVMFRERDYILESYGTDGWIASSASLFEINPSGTDQVIHPDDQRPDFRGQ